MFSVGPESRIASEIQDELRAMITKARANVPSAERDLVQLAGQVAHVLFAKTDSEHLLDFQTYGNVVEQTGEIVFNFSFRARPTRAVRLTADDSDWDPSQGPLALRAPADDGAARGDVEPER